MRATSLQAAVSRQVRHVLQPLLHAACDAASGSRLYRVRIDRLKLNLGAISANRFDREFGDRVIQKFSKALAELIPKASGVQAFETYLLTGLVADAADWGSAPDPRSWLQERLEEDPNTWRAYLSDLSRAPAVLKRLAAIADDATIVAIQQHMQSATAASEGKGTEDDAAKRAQQLRDAMPSAQTKLTTDGRQYSIRRPDASTRKAASTPLTQQEASQADRRGHAHADPFAPMERSANSDPRTAPETTNPTERVLSGGASSLSAPLPAETTAIANAGLILVWPLLPGLLKRAGLIVTKTFPDEPARQSAVRFLDAMIWGNETEPSFERSTFTRLLCGFPATLSVEERAAWEDALWKPPDESAWEAGQRCLDQVRPLLLRSAKVTAEDFAVMFLRRGGGLNYDDGNWIVTVDPDPSDILLGPPPWPLTQVHLPWLTAPLTVDWSISALPTAGTSAPPARALGNGGEKP